MKPGEMDEAAEIEELLPWYEKGTLGPAEMRRVEAYLAAHPEMQARLVLIREELAETIAANESIGLPRASARDRLFEAIAAEGPAALRPHRPGLFSRLGAWLPQGVSPGAALAGAVAALVILVQAAALISLTSGDEASNYRVASGQESITADQGTFVFVFFTAEAKASDIVALMREFDGVVVDGPKPGGAFKVRLSPDKLTAEQREMAIGRLRARSDLISNVTPAG